MKRWGAILTVFALTACSGMVETSSLNGSSLTATPTPAFTCENYYDQPNGDTTTRSFSTLVDCQTTTQANCDWAWEPFPEGTSALCYSPIPGWGACSTTPASWIYTPWNVSCHVSGSVYRVVRSIVGCSSSICICSDPQLIQEDCTDGTDCPVTIPVSPDPTPADCS